MTTLESHVQADIRIELGKLPHVRLFRNNQGVAHYPGGQRVPYGLANPGGADLIGLTQIKITPDMVGQTVAVFTALEIKRPGAKPTRAQADFLAFIQGFGGRAGVAGELTRWAAAVAFVIAGNGV